MTIDAIVERHRPESPASGYCECGVDWPCDTAVIAEDWKRLRRALVQVTDLLEFAAYRLRDQAKADAAIAAARALIAEGGE